jgi:hypothetical protein
MTKSETFTKQERQKEGGKGEGIKIKKKERKI